MNTDANPVATTGWNVADWVAWSRRADDDTELLKNTLGSECEVRGDDIGGIGVHIGARVSALAGPNDVLVSSTLRDLVIGSGLEFDDQGPHELKGVHFGETRYARRQRLCTR
jgi:hypothetical protein